MNYTFDGVYVDGGGVQYEQSITPSDLVYEFDPGSTYYDDELQEDVVTNASISFTMPASNVIFELVGVPVYEVAINNVATVFTYRAGEDIELYIDKNYGNLVDVTPSDLVYTVDTESDASNDIYSFTMPEETVNFTMELPAPGTSFAFVGYLHEEDENAYSTGTVTYEGIYPDDSTYIMGTAAVTFVENQQEGEQEVFILRSDAPSMNTGVRIPVYVMNNNQFALFGYGEITMQ